MKNINNEDAAAFPTMKSVHELVLADDVLPNWSLSTLKEVLSAMGFKYVFFLLFTHE